MSRTIRLLAIVLSASSFAACSSPTAPTPARCSPTGDSPCTNVNFVNPNVNFVNPNVNFVNPNVNYVNPNV